MKTRNTHKRDKTVSIDRHILGERLKADLPVPPIARCMWESTDVHSFERWYQHESINRKRNDGNVPDELKQASLLKFATIQKDMKSFNSSVFSDAQSKLIERARNIVHRLLPPVKSLWEEIGESCSFGPGTSFHVQKPFERSASYKIGGKQTVCFHSADLVLELLDFSPSLKYVMMGQKVSVTRGNRLGFVPKDVTKCRQIAIEPSLNTFIQKGIGSVLSRLMLTAGFADIRDQGEQRIRAAYLENGTIDLSDASDRISIRVVRELLPLDWFWLLNSARSLMYCERKGGEFIPYENFSSQGNAFTFPLETLIFKALALAASGLKSSEVAVYGDDIIAPASKCQQIAEALESMGFKVNTEKSYWGQHEDSRKFFRESCGADYFQGEPVRPVFYKEDAKSYSDVATLYNRLYERWGWLENTHSYLLSLVPEKHRIFGPVDFWSTDMDHPQRNHIAMDYSGWFWGTESQSSVKDYSLKYWCHRPVRIKSEDRITCPNALMQTVCYTGSDPHVSPASIRATGRRNCFPRSYIAGD